MAQNQDTCDSQVKDAQIHLIETLHHLGIKWHPDFHIVGISVAARNDVSSIRWGVYRFPSTRLEEDTVGESFRRYREGLLLRYASLTQIIRLAQWQKSQKRAVSQLARLHWRHISAKVPSCQRRVHVV